MYILPRLRAALAGENLAFFSHILFKLNLLAFGAKEKRMIKFLQNRYFKVIIVPELYP